jgi:hypothetical protein
VLDFGTREKFFNSKSDRRTYCVQMRTLGKPVEFGHGMSDAERNWLIWGFEQHLQTLREATHLQRPILSAGSRAVRQGPTEPSVEILNASVEPVSPPSDCRWSRVEERDALAFVRRGRWDPVTIAALVLLNAFWNGIVSLFVLQLFSGKPLDGEWWGLFLFLIPFEVIGLGMFGILLHALFEPARTTAWEIADRCVRYRLQWFGIGLTRLYQVEWINRLELREGDTDATWKANSWLDFSPHVLALVDSTNTDVSLIENLTEGEARWIADTLRRERGNWFR